MFHLAAKHTLSLSSTGGCKQYVYSNENCHQTALLAAAIKYKGTHTDAMHTFLQRCVTTRLVSLRWALPQWGRICLMAATVFEAACGLIGSITWCQGSEAGAFLIGMPTKYLKGGQDWAQGGSFPWPVAEKETC